MIDIKELLQDDETVMEIAEERAMMRAGRPPARQLERRFGPNPQWIIERLSTASEQAKRS